MGRSYLIPDIAGAGFGTLGGRPVAACSVFVYGAGWRKVAAPQHPMTPRYSSIPISPLSPVLRRGTASLDALVIRRITGRALKVKRADMSRGGLIAIRSD